MSQIQFKRVLDYNGTIDKAIENIRAHITLGDGEPLVCSYKDIGGIKKKYFLAVGVSGNIKIFPSFDDLNEMVDFIRNNSTGINLENTSEDSDVTVTINEKNEYVFKLKDELKGNNN